MDRVALKLISAVVVACVVAALGLGATYGLTRERILEQERLAEEKALKAVLPDAVSFEKIEDEEFDSEAEELTDEVYVSAFEGLDSSGQVVGWGIRVAPRGYGGPIQMSVGLERDGKVGGASIITMNETPGLGTRIADEGFLAQFMEWTVQSLEQDEKGIDVILGATKSTNGVKKGIEAAALLYEEFSATGGGE